MDLKGYKVKGTTKCNCGYEFTIKDMKKLQRIDDSKFYGGAVRHVDNVNCPNCQKETLLLIKQQGQTYIVKDIAQKEKQEAAITHTEVTSNKETNTSNDFICPECEKAFKSKAGLSVHIKSHQNK